jgi:hypothetical protein
MSNPRLAYGIAAPPSSARFAVGDRVIRRTDGTVGVVATIGSGGGFGVRWEPSGVIQMVVPSLLTKA